MLDIVIRKVVPMRIRQDLGCWSLNVVSKSKFLLYPYLWLLHGKVPKNLKLLPNGKASYNYLGYDIVAPRDGIGSFLEVFQDGVYDCILKPKEGDVVIDVGAYVGMFTIKAALQVGKKGMVVACEPSLSNLRYLDKNVEKFDNVRIVEKAISSRDETRKFYISNATACHSLIYPQDVYYVLTTVTLDELNLERVDFIKIDAEGAEMQVLEGATKILEGDVNLAIASYRTGPDGEPEQPKIVAFLKERGFTVITEKGLRGYTYAGKTI